MPLFLLFVDLALADIQAADAALSTAQCETQALSPELRDAWLYQLLVQICHSKALHTGVCFVQHAVCVTWIARRQLSCLCMTCFCCCLAGTLTCCWLQTKEALPLLLTQIQEIEYGPQP